MKKRDTNKTYKINGKLVRFTANEFRYLRDIFIKALDNGTGEIKKTKKFMNFCKDKNIKL